MAIFSTSHLTLKVLAAGTWYTGATVLAFKSISLLAEAHPLRPDSCTWLAVAVLTGILVGTMKAKFFFVQSCRRNLTRIDALERPKVWQFFRPGFFLFLALMIAGGATLSRLAHGNHPFLIGVASLDISIATALFVSSRVFRRSRLQ